MIERLYKYCRYTLIFILMSIISNQLIAQITIAGPQCIIPGITYQYDIKGARNDSFSVKVNIKGGTLTSGISASTDRIKVSSVFVIWKDTSFRQIGVQAKRGNSTLSVQSTTMLNGGKLKEDQLVRRYDSTKSNYTFQCALPTGGACNPTYVYQWQKSEDALKWTDIASTTGKDLIITQQIKKDTYFRRITIETSSNTIGYSDIAVLHVIH